MSHRQLSCIHCGWYRYSGTKPHTDTDEVTSDHPQVQVSFTGSSMTDVPGHGVKVTSKFNELYNRELKRKSGQRVEHGLAHIVHRY